MFMASLLSRYRSVGIKWLVHGRGMRRETTQRQLAAALIDSLPCYRPTVHPWWAAIATEVERRERETTNREGGFGNRYTEIHYAGLSVNSDTLGTRKKVLLWAAHNLLCHHTRKQAFMFYESKMGYQEKCLFKMQASQSHCYQWCHCKWTGLFY